MLVTPHQQPLPYDPADEDRADDEPKTVEGLIDTFHGIQETVFENSGHAERAVHAKSWAIMEGELTVYDDLLPQYAQGLFATPGARHPVILRLSVIPGDILSDEITLPHGLSIKVLDVQGARLSGSEEDTTQDLILVNGPAFNAPNPKAFLANLKLLAGTTDKAEGVKKAASVVNRAVEDVLEAFGGESRTLKGMGGAPMTHPLGDAFYSQTAFRYGTNVAKFSVAPVSTELTALTDQKVDVKGKPDGMRELVADHIARHGGEWDVRVQLRTDAKTMPIEDASKEWPQEDSPYLPVARISVKPQPGWTLARSKAVDDGLSFSVWHGLQDHEPLGGTNRVRKDNYKAASDFRGQANGCPMHEPRTFQSLPD